MGKFEVGTKVRVKSGLYRRYVDNPDVPNIRLMRGQEFHIDENDSVGRSDIGMLLEVIDEAPDSPPQEAEFTEEEVWGDNIDADELGAQLAGMNVSTAKKYLSREEWTLEGMKIARQAEESGENRVTLVEFIDGRILDLDEGSVEDGNE